MPKAPELLLALSPYFLVTREAPAMAALILGSRITTILPEPLAGTDRTNVVTTLRASPRFLRLLETWRWSAPLWKNNVLTALAHTIPAAALIHLTLERIRTEHHLETLRHLTRHLDQSAQRDRAQPHNSETTQREEFLEQICADILKGGPDPGVNICLTSSLDQLAYEHRLTPIRGGQDSVTQRFETKLARRAFTLALPMLLRGSGEVIQNLRSDLHAELESLRSALASALTRAQQADTMVKDPALETAAKRYSVAFDAWAADHLPGDDETGQRLTAGFVRLSAVMLPANSALLCAKAAVRSMSGAGNPLHSASLPSDRAEPMAVITIKEMRIRPETAG